MIGAWNKYRDIALTQRKLYGMIAPSTNWGYLYDEMVKLAKLKGFDVARVTNSRYSEELRDKAVSTKF